MSDVYANGMEVSAKKDDNKSICAMPDVCLSPPSPPAGPIPIPYPNTATASDTSDGSKTVQISGGEIGLKNKSNYKKSNGDEAATKSFGMGVVSHNIQGPMKHAAWSMDVQVEGENVIRHMDLTTHNHSNPPQPAVILDQAKQKIDQGKPLNCKELEAINEDVRKNEMKNPKKAGVTATTASYTGPRGGNVGFFKAMTPQDRIVSGKKAGFASPRKGNQRMACSKKMWGAGGNNNHTEPKLMEQFFPKPGSGTLTMSISWKPAGSTRTKSEACTRCKKGICQAVACGLEIKLCKKGEATTPPCKDGEWVGGA